MTDRDPIFVNDRNLPAERLAEIVEANPWLTATTVGILPQPYVGELVAAAIAREEEIVRARQAAEMGCVVLTNGSVVPREEAILVGDRWLGLPSPPTDRHARLCANVMALAVIGGGIHAGLGMQGGGSRLSFDDFGPPRAPAAPKAIRQAPRTPAEIERRKKRKAQRRSRKGRQ